MTSTFMSDEDNSLNRLIDDMRTLVCDENQDEEQKSGYQMMSQNQVNDTIKSQKYMNQFINFVLNLLNIKNRTL